MNILSERSAGVIPFRVVSAGDPLYLVLHSALVRNPKARWEFPKGGIDAGESDLQAAAREFREETGLTGWEFRHGFERSLHYRYFRDGLEIHKTVVYYVAEVYDASSLICSSEHMPDPNGNWYSWGSFAEISALIYHQEMRDIFAEAHHWLRV